ncbi:hypothetical protein TYRP_005412 [Tyrophagus putrescentiae]|nr:hypothetical protein TYRP_005412 [Tyrophagus putrescentiae]
MAMTERAIKRSKFILQRTLTSIGLMSLPKPKNKSNFEESRERSERGPRIKALTAAKSCQGEPPAQT